MNAFGKARSLLQVQPVAGGRFLIACLVLSILSTMTGCFGKPPKPSIIFLTVDTMRADHLGGYGYHHDGCPLPGPDIRNDGQPDADQKHHHQAEPDTGNVSIPEAHMIGLDGVGKQRPDKPAGANEGPPDFFGKAPVTTYHEGDDSQNYREQGKAYPGKHGDNQFWKPGGRSDQHQVSADLFYHFDIRQFVGKPSPRHFPQQKFSSEQIQHNWNAIEEAEENEAPQPLPELLKTCPEQAHFE